MEWITGRRPELKEATNEGDVWVYDVEADEYLIRNYMEVKEGQPWMEIPPPPNYVKPWRISIIEEARYGGSGTEYTLMYGIGPVARHIRTREAAERIAAIYEEVMS